jgi:hypothetical protein
MEEIPQITEAERLRLEPGDALVIHLNAGHITVAEAGLIEGRVRARLKLGDGIPVMVLPAAMGVSVVRPS